MESNEVCSQEAANSAAAASASTNPMYHQQAHLHPHQADFKVPSSLGEVQRIIGLSLSKIQMGRNQRGGLPLHKNLLVATVLNKARDLYMQETMYMNYKMMTGQFAAAASAASANSANTGQMAGAEAASMHHPQHYHHYGMVANNMSEMADDDMEPVEANEADYDEDSESDVEDECDVTSVPPNNNQNLASYPSPPLLCSSTTSSSISNATQCHASLKTSNGPPACPVLQAVDQQQQQPQPEPVPSASDEGFIDEPDCDCDARNFSTSESRVPFQYCYHCAPFHPSNGRGPTLVPSPSSPTPSSNSAASHEAQVCDSVIYDMDSQSTKDLDSPSTSETSNRKSGTKRRRSSTDDPEDSFEEKKRRESNEEKPEEELDSSPNCSRDESGYQSDTSHTEVSVTFQSFCLKAKCSFSNGLAFFC